jgi:AraC-like DNA-binding protein
MRSFRMATGQEATTNEDASFSVQVIGYREPFTTPVTSSSAIGCFAFYFHQAAWVGTRTGERLLPADSVIIIAPGEPLSHRAQRGTLLRSWIRSAGPAVASTIAAAGLQTREPYPLGAGSDAISVLLALHRACIHPRGCSNAHQLALFSTWCQTVARDATPLRNDHGGIDTVRRHLEATYLATQRLDDLAQRAGCSRAQLCRRFRAAFGCAPLQYVIRLRLEAAREALLTTDRDIADIAETGGFGDRYHFSKLFRAHYGSGPATYRRAR